MTRKEYEERFGRAQAFQKLMALPEFRIVDELMVKLSEEASALPLLSAPREGLERIYDMLAGRQECIALIQNAMREWIQDLQLDPNEIDDGSSTTLKD